MFNIDERLYTLDVGGVPRKEIPRIVDPNDPEFNNGSEVCYTPTEDQLLQLALTIWQVATRERNSSHRRNRPRNTVERRIQFETAERLCTRTRLAFISLLLPFVGGDADKARDLCLRVLMDKKPILDKYLDNWSIIKRPSTVWVDKNTNGIFICENGGRIMVGLNPTNFVFVYNQGK